MPNSTQHHWVFYSKLLGQSMAIVFVPAWQPNKFKNRKNKIIAANCREIALLFKPGMLGI